MGEHEQREPEEHEAAVLPAREAVSIITAGEETTPSEDQSEQTSDQQTATSQK
jgi:hypothetical protein